MERRTVGALLAVAIAAPTGAVLLNDDAAAVRSASGVVSSALRAAGAEALATSANEASRLAAQASFGATPTLISQVSTRGVGGWIDDQAAATGSSYSDLTTRAVPINYCTGKTGQDATNCTRDYFSATPVQMRFYADAITANDQLKQRVAFALSQIVVASDVEVHSTAGLAAFNQIFLDNAFDNYRDILKAVTLNPYMGDYLDMANSAKAAPNENYARELMQLFSIGLAKLNPDGSPIKDAAGAVIPSYTAADVKDVARALTGWTYARLNGAAITDNNQLDYAHPMVMNANNYDKTAKSFLGRTVAANATQDDSVNAVVDAVFTNASTAPFISKQLIQQLVTSNPSAAYVGRVSAVFADNGSGVRGDLKAVVKAVLTDADARGEVKTGPADGKVREPVLLATGLVRMIGAVSDGYAFTTRDAGMGQAPFRSPSVFNFYPPDYPLPQGGGLFSPPSKLISTASVLARHNFVYDWTVSADGRSEFTAQAQITGSTGTQLDWSTWEAFGADVDGMIERINLLALNGTMTAAQRSAMKSAATAVTNANAALQARKRAQVALYIAAGSPLFQVAR